MMGQWVFEEQRGAAVRRAPQEAQLFRSEQAAEGEYAGNDALVREILQNSIDARVGETPLRVRLAVHEADDAPEMDRLAKYFERLKEPLSGRNLSFSQNGCPDIPCRFLVCEDFGTRGLEGDTSLYRDPEPTDGSHQDFYWFWRNIGRSGKTGEDLGRWGLGKTVYRAASRVGCMFGLSVRQSEPKSHLMGQAVLQIHIRDDTEYMPEGYWCASQRNEDGLPLPLMERDDLDQFKRDWKLQRSTESGLSVVAPYIHVDLRAERLLEAVAVHFFLRIVRGELTVEVTGRDLGTVQLDANSIEERCRDMVWDGPKKMKRHVPPPIEFTKKCMAIDTIADTALLGTDRVPGPRDELFSEDRLQTLRRDFAAGELIGLRVRMWLPLTDGSGHEGCADVFLQRLREGGKCESYYVREGMTITKITSSASRRGIQSLVIVEPGPLAELLGDTEGPAHEDWQTSSERPDGTWKTWKGRVKFVRRIVDNLVELLAPPLTEPDFDLLSDFFSIDRIRNPQRQRSIGDDNEQPGAFEELAAKPKWYYVSPRSGGFTLGRNKEVHVPKDARLRLSVAYDISTGNPIKRWSPLDFKLVMSGNGGLLLKAKGLKGELERGNVLLLSVIDDDFKLVVEGFDEQRDLFVRVDNLTDNEENTQ